MGAPLSSGLEAQARAQGCSRCRPLVFAMFPDELERAILTWRGAGWCSTATRNAMQAHRFYHAHGLTIRSFHFAKDLL